MWLNRVLSYVAQDVLAQDVGPLDAPQSDGAVGGAGQEGPGGETPLWTHLQETVSE